MTDSAASGVGKQGIWAGLIVVASVAFSFVMACGMPFAALGALAALHFGRGRALAAVLVAWIGNQAIGYGVLNFPTTWDSFAWGGAIGLAAVAGLLAALQVGRMATSPMIAYPGALLAAFAAYELTLFAATAVLPSSGNGFSASVVSGIFAANVMAFVLLLALQSVGSALGVADLRRSSGPRFAA